MIDKKHYDLQYQNCNDCQRDFSRNSFINRKLCFDCWYKKNKVKIKSNNLREAVDLYNYGSHEKVILAILKGKNQNEIIKRFKKLLKIDKFDLYKFYLKFRELEKKEIKIIEKTADPKYYSDECPYCHSKILFDRFNSEGFKCPICEKFIKRMYHPK